MARDGGGGMCCGQVSTLGGVARRSQKGENKRCSLFSSSHGTGVREEGAVAPLLRWCKCPRFLYKSSPSLRMLTTCYKNIQSNSHVDLEENIHLPCHSTQQSRVLMDLQFFTANTQHLSGEVPKRPPSLRVWPFETTQVTPT